MAGGQVTSTQDRIATLEARLHDGFTKPKHPVFMRGFPENVVELERRNRGAGRCANTPGAAKEGPVPMQLNPTPTCDRCKQSQPRDQYAQKWWGGRPNGLDRICATCRRDMAQTPIDNGDGTFCIPFGHGNRALVDAQDVPLVAGYHWYLVNSGYAFAQCGDGKRIGMHRLILGLADDDRRVGDHINRDKLDNRRCNLRAVTYAENNRRRVCGKPAGATSQFRGVSWTSSKRRWRAAIRANYRTKCLGYFRNELDAARAYDAAARHFYGDFATLNFPDEAEVA